MNKVINEVKGKMPISKQEEQSLKEFLKAIDKKLNLLKLKLNFNQWVAMSIHLVNFIRRVKRKETIPTIEQTLWDQLSPRIIELSHSILEPFKNKLQDSHYSSEVFLLAVHLEGASPLEGGE